MWTEPANVRYLFQSIYLPADDCTNYEYNNSKGNEGKDYPYYPSNGLADLIKLKARIAKIRVESI